MGSPASSPQRVAPRWRRARPGAVAAIASTLALLACSSPQVMTLDVVAEEGVPDGVVVLETQLEVDVDQQRVCSDASTANPDQPPSCLDGYVDYPLVVEFDLLDLPNVEVVPGGLFASPVRLVGQFEDGVFVATDWQETPQD